MNTAHGWDWEGWGRFWPSSAQATGRLRDHVGDGPAELVEVIPAMGHSGLLTACPIGAMAFYFGVSRVIKHPDVLGWGLAVSAGFFIGIALADLLPEVEFHDTTAES